MILEIINGILYHELASNANLVHSLLYKRSLFERFRSYPNFQEVVHNIETVSCPVSFLSPGHCFLCTLLYTDCWLVFVGYSAFRLETRQERRQHDGGAGFRRHQAAVHEFQHHPAKETAQPQIPLRGK